MTWFKFDECPPPVGEVLVLDADDYVSHAIVSPDGDVYRADNRENFEDEPTHWTCIPQNPWRPKLYARPDNNELAQVCQTEKRIHGTRLRHKDGSTGWVYYVGEFFGFMVQFDGPEPVRREHYSLAEMNEQFEVLE